MNKGFSGGEKKKGEVLQMHILKPVLCLLDETDSGLDVDALKIVAEGVNAMRSKERSFPDYHTLRSHSRLHSPGSCACDGAGRIVESGEETLAHTLEKRVRRVL